METNERRQMILTEGGNVFKKADKAPATQRINRIDVPTTVKWLEQVTGLSLMDAMVGSTGHKETSGDIDLAIDANMITKDAVLNTLIAWCRKNGIPDEQIMNRKAKGKNPAMLDGWIDQTGIEIHFKCPINGDPKQGLVQVDFNFLTQMAWSKFMLAAMPPDSEYKGVDRAVLFNSIGKTLGVKAAVNTGVHDRATNELVTTDPAKFAHLLLGPQGTVKDLASVESTIAALRNDPQRDAKLHDFAEYLQRSGRQMPQLESSAHPSNWFKYINQRLK
jgi:hypothetical protein